MSQEMTVTKPDLVRPFRVSLRLGGAGPGDGDWGCLVGALFALTQPQASLRGRQRLDWGAVQGGLVPQGPPAVP